MKLNAILLVLVAVIAVPAAAQDMAGVPNPDATPTYGELELITGFEPNPYEVRVQAGGPIDGAEALSPRCPGHFAAAPDINFSYVPSRYPLQIYIDADADTTLIIFGPNEEYYCNDDFADLNPAVIFRSPQEGIYRIWVGTYRQGATHPASIMFSEMRDEDEALSDN